MCVFICTLHNEQLGKYTIITPKETHGTEDLTHNIFSLYSTEKEIFMLHKSNNITTLNL